MRDILEQCVELDRAAYETYRGVAAACADQGLRSVFEQMAKEELQHVDWWSDLLAAWESGLVPDIAHEHDLIEGLAEVRKSVAETLPERLDSLSIDEMLDLAARLEFYMLDPVFGEFIDLAGPGGQADRSESYSRHVLRLVEAIERYHSSPALATFLARMLLRAHRDQQRFAALSVRDQLTELYNRRGLLGHISQWLAWSARYDRPVAVVLVDIDWFKDVNDRYGHPVGDEVLRAVAGALEQGARTSDMLGRFGGDEFLVLAPETGEEELRQLMERLLERVREIPRLISGHPVEISVSVGGAWVSGGSAVEPEAIIAAADRSLYEAKAQGRNRAGSAIRTATAALA